MRPYALWEVATGRVLVDARVAALWRQPRVGHMAGAMAEQLAGHLAAVLRGVGGARNGKWVADRCMIWPWGSALDPRCCAWVWGARRVWAKLPPPTSACSGQPSLGCARVQAAAAAEQHLSAAQLPAIMGPAATAAVAAAFAAAPPLW